jgi:hypothetical protein
VLRNLYSRFIGPLAVGGACLLLSSAAADSAGPALPGYLTVAGLTARLQALGTPAQVEQLGATSTGAPVLAAEFACSVSGPHPALAVVGGLGPAQNCGAELVLRLAERLAAGGTEAEAVLSRMSVYLIALPSPDAVGGASGRRPYSSATVNALPADDDRDGRLDEDGPEDLNGDGWITQLRVKDPAGQYRTHPLDPRVLIPVKPDASEQGEYSIYTEGLDNDHDGLYNEDGPGGVDFDRNWSWNYELYGRASGFNPVSERETRAVADFLFNHPELSMVYTLGPQDNLAHPWQAGNDGGRIKTGVLADDAPVLKLLGDAYKQQFDSAAAPSGAPGDGSFPYWAYFHYGRWSLAALPWWMPAEPKPEEKKPEEKKPEEKQAEAGAAPAGQPADAVAKPAWDEKDERGKDDLRRLKWLETNHIDGFVPWTPITDPDFPGAVVEVGGLRQLRADNPPAAELDGLADRQLKFLASVAALQPQLVIDRVKVEDRGGGVYRVEARVVNTGYLPTVSAMGELSRQNYPLQASVTLPAGAQLLSRNGRHSVPRLPGQGGSAELDWLVQAEAGAVLHVDVASPAVGEVAVDIPLRGGAA